MLTHSPYAPAALHRLLLCIQDWIGHCIGEAYGWNAYDTTFHAVLKEQTRTLPLLVCQWRDAVLHAPLTLPVLLVRHYLFTAATDEEIFPSPDYIPLYALMASMATDPVVFAPLPDQTPWTGIPVDPHPINRLRHNRPFIQTYARTLAMRDDETDDRLLCDHGQLSALSLLYGLSLIQVILTHVVTVHPDSHVEAILASLSHTLVQSQGVFHHVESQWLCPHVQ